MVGLVGVPVLQHQSALAKESGSESSNSVERDSNAVTQQNASGTVREEDRDSEEDQDSEDVKNEDAGGTDEGEQGDEHRSRVSEVVRGLKEAADKDKDQDIKDDLDEVADEEASSSERAADAMHGLENENSFKKFIFGPDFKSLGALRSTVVATENHIDRLTKAEERITDPAAKATLDAQIEALKDIASGTQAFIDSHESAFSLLGWFMKLFSKQ